MDYKHDGHTVHLVVYHIIWCPKRRRKVLVGPVCDRLKQIIGEVAAEHDWEIIRLAIQPDQVHLFIRANPYTLPSDIPGLIKGRSSHDLREESPHLLKLPSLWTRSFFLSTAGNVSQEIIHRRSSRSTSKGNPRREATVSECKTTVQVRLYPTPAQATLLRAHCQEYISTINVLVTALNSDVLPDGGKGASTKDFIAALPSAVKNQALRDARSVWNRSLALGVIPVLRKPVCQWNNQNWRMEGDRLLVPVSQDGRVEQIAIRCAAMTRGGKPGILRIKRKRGRWIADIALTLPEPEPTTGEAVMGVDLGIKLPAVVHVIGKGTRYVGNGRSQRFRRRRFHAGRKQLQKAGKVRAVRKSQGKERRWMRDINHKLSRQIVAHAQQQGVGIIRLEELAGIRRRISQRTACTSRGAKRHHAARKNNRMKNTWSFFQLTQFITYKAERLGIRVEQVDPSYTSQTCPACFTRNKADDRRYVCAECGWMGHRDAVGAINIARRAPDTGRRGDSVGAAVASGSDGGWAA
jgi:putative transposase